MEIAEEQALAEQAALEAVQGLDSPENSPDFPVFFPGTAPKIPQEPRIDSQTKKDLDISASKSKTVPGDGSLCWFSLAHKKGKAQVSNLLRSMDWM